MPVQHLVTAKTAVDATAATGLVTAPFWMQWLGDGLGILVALVGLVWGVYRACNERLEYVKRKREALRKNPSQQQR